MAQSTNLPVKDPTSNFDQRVQDYFTNYFNSQIKMTDNDYELVKSFFVQRTDNEQAAAALTAAVIQAANELDVYAIDVIENFQNSTNLKVAVPTFINLSRRGSSLLGYEAGITPTENIKRQTEA
jgi:N-acetylglucosamine kinase-like BadF-type ATPase